jgi:hypothetical protein
MTEARLSYTAMTKAALERLEKRIVATRRWFYVLLVVSNVASVGVALLAARAIWHLQP